MAQFERYIGVDYSGAETPDSSCQGLRVYVAEGTGTPEPVQLFISIESSELFSTAVSRPIDRILRRRQE